MKKLISLLLVLSTLSLARPTYSHAQGFIIEPYYGLETGDWTQGQTHHDTSGQLWGLRLGGVRSNFLFGFDYSRGTVTAETPTRDYDYNNTDLGFFLGYRYSALRMWLTYWFDSDGDASSSEAIYTGQGGYKVGFGFLIASSLSLNFEKSLRVWREHNASPLDRNIEWDGVLLSLSMPLIF